MKIIIDISSDTLSAAAASLLAHIPEAASEIQETVDALDAETAPFELTGLDVQHQQAILAVVITTAIDMKLKSKIEEEEQKQTKLCHEERQRTER